jgi:hypothetical protein
MLVWVDSDSVESTTAKAGYPSPIVDPANMLDPSAKELVQAMEVFPKFPLPANPLNLSKRGAASIETTPDNVQDVLPPADPPNSAIS